MACAIVLVACLGGGVAGPARPDPNVRQVASISVAEAYPFVGTWDCEVSEFTFSTTHYRVGTDSGPIRIQKVERSESDGPEGPDFRITLEDGYAFSLFDVRAKTMTWHSLESGDTFDCKRVM